MTLAAAVLIVLALLAELAGLVLVVREARDAGKHFRALVDAAGPAGSSYDQLPLLAPAITAALGDPRRRWMAVALLLAGIVLGAAGNLVSLAA